MKKSSNSGLKHFGKLAGIGRAVTALTAATVFAGWMSVKASSGVPEDGAGSLKFWDGAGMKLTLDCEDGPAGLQICPIKDGVMLLNPVNGESRLCDGVSPGQVYKSIEASGAAEVKAYHHSLSQMWEVARLCTRPVNYCSPQDVGRLVRKDDSGLVAQYLLHSPQCGSDTSKGYAVPSGPQPGVGI